MSKEIAYVLIGNNNGNKYWVQLLDRKKKIILERISEDMEAAYAIQWLLAAMQPVFLALPLENMELQQCPYTLEAEALQPVNQDKLRQIVAAVVRYVEATHQFLQQQKQHKNAGRGKKRVMAYVFEEDDRFRNFFAQHNGNTDNLLRTFPSGWDPVARIWAKEKKIMPPEELVQLLVQEQIGRIVTINFYVDEMYLAKYQIHLSAVLVYLGIERRAITSDPFEIMSYSEWRNYDHDDMVRYTCTPTLHYHWENDHKKGWLQYSTVIRDYKEWPGEFRRLQEPYKVVVCTMSKIQNIMRKLGPILFLMERLVPRPDLGQIGAAELQLWYLASRQFIIDRKLPPEQTMRFLSGLLDFMYIATNFLKFRVLELLEPHRQIELYGDPAWEYFFPQYFKGYITSEEVEGLMQREDTLLLLLNVSFSYMDCGGPVYDALCHHTPFLSWRATVKPPSLEALDKLEYDDGKELNRKIAEAGKIFSDQELQSGVGRLQNMFFHSAQAVADEIFHGKKQGMEKDEYARTVAVQQKIMEEKIQKFLSENRISIDQMLGGLFSGEAFRQYRPEQYAPQWSRLDFCQKLLEYQRTEWHNPGNK